MALLKQALRTRPVQGAIRRSAAFRAQRFQQRDPLAAQRAIFQQLVSTAAGTRFGRDHDFPVLARLPYDQAYARFRQLVPIRTYQEFWDDYFQAGCRTGIDGKKRICLDDVTWPGRVRMFCETSGTTAPTKYIPFSDQMFQENRRAATDMIACYLAVQSTSRLGSGKILYMSGSTELNDMGDHICSGDMSALTLRFRPRWLDPFVEPQAQVSALPWEEKLQAMAELLLNDPDIRVISGVPPWILLLLKRCAELGGRPLVELLPHLELIIHGGTSIKPYRSEFEALFHDRLPNLLELLPSSEAFMAFQQQGDAQMRLTPFYGAFFEFVRFEDLDGQGRPVRDAAAVPLEQVQTGQRYAVILSTCSGLWRYHIGDTIRFTSLAPHFIEFTGRDRFLDKLEEKVTQGEVERAIAELNGFGSWNVREFMVGADVQARRHVWVLATAEEGGNREQAALLLDAALCHMNADYATFRSQGRINPPLVLTAGEGAIYAWSKTARGKLGGQTKIPHIDPTPDSSMIASLQEFVAQG
ncbi:GH3 auxin-responsive promoter family protein [Oryzomonas japonica]|uniref:GH3 auxin-responsive promoter family protein n=1 Tax=Oryzomonas japonica TaxID=2603858 RepID=A0A7J4ZQE2_9BACT|nr:GH3 auxin-responsive promoter family protein [Oryzomonas japonica]KAB0665039.1 GH3 auxin-responsive promoter family protein [Oryzomonas japonica]